MTDEQLLQLTAKAVGGEFSPGTCKTRTGPTWESWKWVGPLGVIIERGVSYPLTHDADALGLAILLKMHVLIHGDWVEVLIDGVQRAAADSCYSSDRCMRETTRRAIVQAAAAVGSDL